MSRREKRGEKHAAGRSNDPSAVRPEKPRTGPPAPQKAPGSPTGPSTKGSTLFKITPLDARDSLKYEDVADK